MSDTKTRRFGRFTLKRTLGHGGVGTVFLASEDGSDVDVAIKILPFAALSPFGRYLAHRRDG